MKGLKLYRKSDVERLISTRKGEVKFGENLQFISKFEELEIHPAEYVLLGIPEDIGVRANFGKAGTSKAWKAALKSLVNIQVNRFNNPENVILLGELDCGEFMNKASLIDESDPNYHSKLGDFVKEIDQLVSDLIQFLISKGKVPIIIGGGHNNAYGNIKGAAKALKDPINVINIDAHTDLRQLEHRHSGNGFSYAIEGQFLRKYCVFGLHSNYTPEYIFTQMDSTENVKYHLTEDQLPYSDELTSGFQKCLEEFESSKFGFELDCDAMANFPSSAQSPSGFSVDQVRKLVSQAGKRKNCCYFHICEAAPKDGNETQVGKALAYFISDFIR
ncbi:formimidoylglutamase [Christiangramia sp.]|uniref:formimidoylglutamase n=1 Tax=Christiangramia sp. TaxID=1931228 RepID=UPI00261CEEC4|nr:formimidoylglutamase [Christiangramia sp.]